MLVLVQENEKYSMYRAIQPSNPNIHFLRLTINVSRVERATGAVDWITI